MANEEYNPREVAESIDEDFLRQKRDEYRRRADKLNEMVQWMNHTINRGLGDQRLWSQSHRDTMSAAHDRLIDASLWYESVQWEIEERMESE